MNKSLDNWMSSLSWQTKLILSGSTAIFFTFFLLSFIEYQTVSNWMLKQEETAVQRTITDIATYYKDRAASLTVANIGNSKKFLRKMNNKDQLIRVYDQKGKILASDKNGDFSVLEPKPAKQRVTETISEEGNEALIARYPISGVNFQGTLEIVRQLNSYHKMMDHFFWVMMVFGIAAILLSAISGFFLAKQLLKPVRQLADAMKKIKENGFQERMKVYKRKDELTDLTNLFNEMMDAIEKSFLQQKQFVEDASHELRTPVSILEGHLALLNRWGKKDAAILDESLEASLQELTRLKKLIVDLLELTRAENTRILSGERAHLPTILQRLVKNLELIHPDFDFIVKVDRHLSEIAMSEQHLQQVLIILLDNSVKYSREYKKIIISAKEEDDNVFLSVKDQGIGISLEHIQDVFNRFYRVDKARSRESGGTGLGLSIAKQILEKNNGTISIESKEGIGTTVNIILPSVSKNRR